ARRPRRLVAPLLTLRNVAEVLDDVVAGLRLAGKRLEQRLHVVRLAPEVRQPDDRPLIGTGIELRVAAVDDEDDRGAGGLDALANLVGLVERPHLVREALPRRFERLHEDAVVAEILRERLALARDLGPDVVVVAVEDDVDEREPRLCLTLAGD